MSADLDKEWLMGQEPPLPVEPDKTDPYGRLSHIIGTDDDFWALDYHVFPDSSVQLHAVINSETGGFVQDARPPVRVPASDALEQAQQLVDAALEWAAENGANRAAWRASQREGRFFIEAIGREIDPGYDPRTNEARPADTYDMSRAEFIVEQLLETPMSGEQRRIKCRNGWVFWSRRDDGRYYVTASGHRAQTVDQGTFRHFVDELVRALGGEVRS